MKRRLVLNKVELRHLTDGELDGAVGAASGDLGPGIKKGVSAGVQVEPVPNTSSAPWPTIFYSGGTIGYVMSAAGSGQSNYQPPNEAPGNGPGEVGPQDTPNPAGGEGADGGWGGADGSWDGGDGGGWDGGGADGSWDGGGADGGGADGGGADGGGWVGDGGDGGDGGDEVA